MSGNQSNSKNPNSYKEMKASDLPENYNSIDILERNLSERADKVALYYEDRELTFRQVSDEVNQVGTALKKLDVRSGEVVGILSLDCPEWVTSFFGTLKINAISLGMNTLLKSHDYSFILRDARARVLIVHEEFLDLIDRIRDEVPFLEHVIVIGKATNAKDLNYAEWIGDASRALAISSTHRDDFATLNYSSGTTGEPKGILHAHKDLPLTAELWGKNVLGLKETDCTLAAAKLFFTFGTGGNLIFPWYVGGSAVLFAGTPRVATNMLEIIDHFKPTIFYNAPTGYALMLAVENFTKEYDLSSLRLCVSAGEALPASIWQQWKEQTGVDIIDGIGSTELYHIFLSNRPGDIRPGSSGKAFAGYELKITDEDGKEVEAGGAGNLLVKGESAALFYLHNYERSRKTFLGEWVFTGDKYYRDDDGYYWHAGRSDDMLKVGGIWVSPVEVESALVSHPSVLECAVIGSEDKAGLIKPKAFVVLKDTEASEELTKELINHCQDKIASYKRPRWIEYVDELPKTATGKIQRFRLREI
ncbi:benzoate-CoA ligase family protein [Acidobacteriota bacterium]